MRYALCKAEDIKKYITKQLKQPFDAGNDCHGCVFTSNVNMLHEFMSDSNPKWITKGIKHENFI